eukprot:767602_1
MGCINTIPKEPKTQQHEQTSETNTHLTNPSPSLRGSINSGDSIAITPSLNSLNSIFSPRYETTVQEMDNRFREAFQLNMCKNAQLQTTFNRINSRSITLETSNTNNKIFTEPIEEPIEETFELNDALGSFNNIFHMRRITTLECKIEETEEQQNQLLHQMEVEHKLTLENENVIQFINPHCCYEDYHEDQQSD